MVTYPQESKAYSAGFEKGRVDRDLEIERVRLSERERCIKIAESYYWDDDTVTAVAANDIIANIVAAICDLEK